MSKFLKASGRLINLENVTHAQVQGATLVLHPANYYPLRLAGEEAGGAYAMLKAIGFVGDANMLVNPIRVIAGENAGAIARLMLEGSDKMIAVPAAFLEMLEGPAEAVSNAGNSDARPRRKKGAE